MDINNNTMINVCNYEPCKVIATSNVQDYIFDGCEYEETPIVISISAVELKNIHSKSSIFTDGYLTFEDNDKEAVYEYLKIKNWQDILTQKDIVDAILNCTKEKLQKIIDITSLAYFERVRGVYIALKQSNADVSMRVANVIEARYKELRQNKYKSSIQLRDVSFSSNSNKEKDIIAEQQEQINKKNQEIDKKNQEIEELMKEFEQLRQTVEKLTKSQQNEDKPNTPPKKRGRPAKPKE